MTNAIVLLLIRPTRVLPHGLGDDLLDMYRTFAGDPVTESADITAHIARGVASCAAINTAELFSKTGNNLGAKSGRLRRSGMVWGLAGSGFGTNLVQIEFAERPVAQGCVGSLFASDFGFVRFAGNSVLAAA